MNYEQVEKKQTTLMASCIAVIIALIFITRIVLYVYNIQQSQTYSQLIVGNIAWLNDLKTPELYSVIAIIMGLPLVYWNILIFLNITSNKFSGNEFLDIINSLWLIILPGALSIVFLLTQSQVNFFLLNLSIALLLFVILNILFSVWLKIDVNPLLFFNLSAFAVFSSFVPIELYILLTKSKLMKGNIPEFFNSRFYFIVLVIQLMLLTALFFIKKNVMKDLVVKIAFWLGIFSQCGLLLLYLTLIPSIFIDQNGLIYSYNITIYYKLFVICLVFIGMVDLIRKCRMYYTPHVCVESLNKIYSPIAVFALAYCFLFSNTSLPIIASDDFHFGEKLLGWWSLKQGLLPYLDIRPAHGMIDDYFSQFLSELFYSGLAADYTEAERISFVIIGLLTVIFINSQVKNCAISILIFISLLCGTYGRQTWLFLVAIFSIFINDDLINKPSRWILTFIFIAPIVILFSPGQGSIAIVSLSSIGFICFYKICRKLEKRSSHFFYFLVLSAVVIGITPNFYSMLYEALAYVADSGKINQIAHGISWSKSWNSNDFSIVWREVLRSSWIIVAVFLLINIFTKIRSSCMSFHINTLVINLPIILISLFLFLLFVLPYSMGRIDASGLSRTGLVSIFSWGFIFPIACMQIYNIRFRYAYVCFGAIICSMISVNMVNKLDINRVKISVVDNINTVEIIDGKDFGVPNLGKGIVDQKHLLRLSKLNSVLSQYLEVGEPYLDLTSHNADYFYMNRLPPVVVSAPYNMVTSRQQLIDVSRLNNRPPRIALIEGSNINFDGGGLLLRSPILARFVLDSYDPYYKDGFILGLLRKERSNTPQILPMDLEDRNDDFWSHGVSKKDPNLLVNKKLLRFIHLGDKLLFNELDSRTVVAINYDDQVLSFNGEPINQIDNIRVSFLPSIVNFNQYREALFEEALSMKELMKIPVAWGKSLLSLKNQMSLIVTLSDSRREFHNFIYEDGLLKVEGNDPFISFNTEDLMLSGINSGLMKVYFECLGMKEIPRIQIFWWGDDQVGASEEASLKFTAENGYLIVPLDSSVRWLSKNHIRGIRIDLDNPAACSKIRLSEPDIMARAK